jgi:flagellar basal-body rod protein FlgB
MSFLDVDFFSVALQRMRHSAARQQVIARNVANADIPGEQARELAAFDFVRELDQARAGHGGAVPQDPAALARTAPGHLDGGDGREGFAAGPATESWDELPRGGDIALEQQMLAMTEAKLRHDSALAYYRKAAELMRTAASAKF